MEGAELAGLQVARRTSPALASGAAPGVALAQGLLAPAGTDTLSVPIGSPALGARHYTLGAGLRPAPVSAPGELYLSGVQLAQGGMAPSGLEQAVAQVPGNERLGRDDDFCTPGGTSSAATQVARLAAEPNCPLGVRDGSTARAVAERGELVERASGSGGASLVAQLRAWPRPPLVPLSPERQRVRSRNPFQRSSHAVSFLVGSRGPVDAFDMPSAVENPEAIAFELPELSVSPSTLDTGATTLDFQLTVTENPAGAGLGEGSASAGIRAGIPYATLLVCGATVCYANRMVGFLRVISNAGIAARPALSATGARENALVPVLRRVRADGYSVAPLTGNLMRLRVGRSAGRAPTWIALVVRHHRYCVGHPELFWETTDSVHRLWRRLAFWRPQSANAADLLALSTDHRRRRALGYAAGKAVFADSALIVDSEGNRR